VVISRSPGRGIPSLLLVLFALALPTTALLADKGDGGVVLIEPCPAEGCIISVAVGPDGGSTSHPQNSGIWTVLFDVTNTGNVSTPYQFTCSATGVTCKTVSPASATLGPGQEVSVTVAYIIGSVNGRVTLTANNFGGSATNTGFYNVTATVVGPPAIALKNQNGDNLARGLCLTAGAGEAAGASCGDLVVTHGMPAFRTLGRDRALTLAYNSSTVLGSALVAAWVTEAATLPTPDKVVAVLTVGTAKDSADFTPIPPNTTRQIVMGRGISGLATGVYPMTLLVRNVYGTAVYDDTATGRMLVVNRAASEFGRGWSLLGLEQVVSDPTDSTRRVWVTGDGSIRLYHQGVALTAPMLSQSGLTGFLATAALDGNTASNAWHTDASTPGAWLRADLGAQPRAATTVGVYANPNQQAIYDIEYSDDATTWAKAYAGFRLSGGWSRVTWNSVGAHRYWRLLLTNTPGPGGWVTELSFGSTNNFYGAPGVAPDSLVRYDSLGTKWYRRTLRHGATVKLDETGRHRLTQNRVGARTVFTWGTVNGQTRLTSIVVPPNGVSGTTYTLAYDNTTGVRLDKITDPGVRVLDATMTGSDLTVLKDPDTKTTGFGYDGLGRLTLRTNRRGFTTTYQYASGVRVTRVTVPTGMLPTDPGTAVTQLLNWDERGLAMAAASQSPADTTQSRTIVRGARWNAVPDTAVFWVNRWGGPVRTQNAKGAVTTIARGDPAVPASVTRVTYPNGRIVTMMYDGRGSLTQMRDSTSHLGAAALPTKVTRYTYTSPNTADSPDSLIDSVGTTTRSARVTRYVYSSLGLTDTIIDPRKHRTSFGYATGSLAGLVTRVTEHKVQTWVDSTGFSNDTSFAVLDQVQQFSFDTKGNLKSATSPSNVITSYTSDALGRVTDQYDPLGLRQQWTFDALNRVTQSTQYTAKTAHPGSVMPLANCRKSFAFCGDSTRSPSPSIGAAAVVRYFWGPLDLDSIVDARGVARRFVYDGRGLKVQDKDGYDTPHVRSYAYDVAGNMTRMIFQTTNPAPDTVYYQVDTLSRRTSVRFAPQFIDEGSPGDTIRYTYDVMGNMLTAANRNGSIVRTYYADGSVRSKKSNAVFPDSMAYQYSETGARTRFSHTANGFTDVVDYGYSAATGDLQTMTAHWGAPANVARTITFLYDTLGRWRQITYPNSMVVKYRYDGSGILRRVVSLNPATPLNGDRFDFTFRTDSVDAVGRSLRQRATCPTYKSPDIGLGHACGAGPLINWSNRYNRFGQLVSQNSGIPDVFDFDASGNMVSHKIGSQAPHFYRISTKSDRILADSIGGSAASSVTYFKYDSTGNRTFDYTTTSLLRIYYYDGLGRTSGIRDSEFPGSTRATCIRYDADGNILAACDERGNWLQYDGSNVAGATSTKYWSFVHGPGVDAPLVGLWRDRSNPSVSREWFWVTDGTGRQLATGAGDGTLGSIIPQEYTEFGGSYAGGTQQSNTFGADRFGSPIVPGLSFFRNRVYDQGTGRWTQEDPAGVGAGLNLYQFNGNNPVANSDPFGLCPTCFPALVAGVAVGGIRLGANLLNDRPAFENVGRDAIFAGAAVLTLGAAVPAIATAASSTAGTATTTAAASGGTLQKIGDALEAAGAGMDARVTAVARIIGAQGKEVLMQDLPEGAKLLSGGAGPRHGQIILNADGSSIVKAYNVAKDIYETVRTIKP
jgi:RHS repeat-associated protein